MTLPTAEIFPASALTLARRVDLLILDVDGVMTDGRLLYGGSIAAEGKAFYAQDGAAIKMLQGAGIPVAIITGRRSEATTRRVDELGIAYVYQGVEDKMAALRSLCGTSGIMADRMAHVGDDIPDLPLFDRVGMRLTVPEAHPEVAARADHVTAAGGGAGAVREICHLILVAKGLWESALTAAGAAPG